MMTLNPPQPCVGVLYLRGQRVRFGEEVRHGHHGPERKSKQKAFFVRYLHSAHSLFHRAVAGIPALLSTPFAETAGRVSRLCL